MFWSTVLAVLLAIIIWFFGVRLLAFYVGKLNINKGLKEKLVLGLFLTIGGISLVVVWLLFPENPIWRLFIVFAFLFGFSKLLNRNAYSKIIISIIWITFFISMPIYYWLTLKGL